MPAIRIDQLAEDDLARIAMHIGVEHHDPDAACRFIDDIHAKFAQYARQPEMGEPRDDLSGDLRSFPFKKSYVVIYRCLDDGIDVLRVIHGARDYRRLFGD